MSESSSSPEGYCRQRLSLPKPYKLLDVMGEGFFGTVVKAGIAGSDHTVAIKIPKCYHNLTKEASMLRVLMKNNLDKSNIIEFHGEVTVGSKTGLSFEMMDISLQDYLLKLQAPMRLEDIRTVIKDMATAFNALKSVGIIHTDVKIDNIMMVDHVRRPFRVKLIDFGLAMFSSHAVQGRVCQPHYYRAPEIILGLPFSEAIDIWSLGCVMAIMMFGFMLFQSRFDYDTLQFIIDLLGPPPDHLLNNGLKTNLFFNQTDSDQWVFQTPEEFWGSENFSTDSRFYTFRSLDEMKTMYLDKGNMAEVDERSACIELLKAMLTWDASERITPSEILNHPFITKSYLNSQATTRTSEGGRTNRVRPASPMSRIHMEDKTDTGTDRSSYISVRSDSSLDTTSSDKDAKVTSFGSDDSTGKRKKKKNIFRRVFNWMRKTLFS